MISKQYRFHGSRSLRFLLSRGRTIRTDFFKLRHARNRRLNHYRLAIIVGKKIEKKAVARNRIRRRLYELLRQRWQDYELRADLAIIVLSADLATLPQAQLLQLFEPVCRKLEAQYGAEG